MKASHSSDTRRVDWSQVKGDAGAAMRGVIVQFVAGIRGARVHGVSREQIVRWFRGTPRAFVEAGIGDAVMHDQIRCCRKNLGSARRSNGAHEYVICESVEPRTTIEGSMTHAEAMPADVARLCERTLLDARRPLRSGEVLFARTDGGTAYSAIVPFADVQQDLRDASDTSQELLQRIERQMALTPCAIVAQLRDGDRHVVGCQPTTATAVLALIDDCDPERARPLVAQLAAQRDLLAHTFLCEDHATWNVLDVCRMVAVAEERTR